MFYVNSRRIWVVLDTSKATAEESVEDFVRQVEPFLEETARLGMQLHKIK